MEANIMNRRGRACLPLVILLALIGICIWFCGTHTVIRAEKSLFWIEKPYFGLDKIYVDVRDWDMMDYLSHPDIAKELARRGIEQRRDEGHKEQTGENLPQKLGRECEEALEKARDITQDLTERLGRQ